MSVPDSIGLSSHSPAVQSFVHPACETGTIHPTANAIIPVLGYEPHDLYVMQRNETPPLVTRTNAVIPLLADSICKMKARRSNSNPGILVSGSTWPNLRFNVSDVVGSCV